MEIFQKLFVISGPSGAGKSTLVAQLVKELPDLYRSVSVTTRARRPGEAPEVNYHFLTEEEFEKKREQGEFLEWAVVHGHKYGTLYQSVKEALLVGQDVILEIDVQGALQVKNKIPESILIFIQPPSIRELEKRLKGRETEGAEELKRRMETAIKEIQSRGLYDYAIINDQVERAAAELIEIVKRERRRKKAICI